MQLCSFDLMGEGEEGGSSFLPSVVLSTRARSKPLWQPVLSLQESCGQLGCIYPASSLPL